MSGIQLGQKSREIPLNAALYSHLQSDVLLKAVRDAKGFAFVLIAMYDVM